MAADLYPCALWRDRPHPLSLIMGPKELERFCTALDPRDGRSMNDAIVAAASRHGGRDLTLYQLDVFHPRTGEPLHSHPYRYTAYLSEPPMSLVEW